MIFPNFRWDVGCHVFTLAILLLPRCCFSCLKPSRRLGVLLTQAREDSRCHWQGMESMGISDDGDIWRCDLGVSGSWTLWRCCHSTTFVTPTVYTRLLLKTGTFFFDVALTSQRQRIQVDWGKCIPGIQQLSVGVYMWHMFFHSRLILQGFVQGWIEIT